MEVVALRDAVLLLLALLVPPVIGYLAVQFAFSFLLDL